ncbi:hypothetical protein QG034_00790 [Kingella kingae]|uniref:hypothetical protein n=1 Tax=Kingella kingae TaxID=504 RepID=UPI00050A2918|nr:hypothetical protein [Kingella kingae]MDK4525458.1 hypothetical protein [Kingella kingae]MDK4531483.1 hypothetical protein [Kingella kingae]MDK4536103.1 hypothetical protein [Kingella kingae]MDK4538942.1 hypothetical protein [Kingella kingae]MDK4546099.1 hypothetical protein [Kingella kingae]
MSSPPKTVEEIFQVYESKSGWKSGDLESEICQSSMGRKQNWTYQNIKTWVGMSSSKYPNIAKTYVNCLYDKANDSLPSELSHLQHLLDIRE